jgi:hypothetical protein
MSSDVSWPAVAFLDALRPAHGWTVETALLASYSADIVSLVAALLALAGRDDEAGDGNPADLADAVEQLRGKAFFVIQEGRLAAMRKRAAISVIVDQFVKSVKSNEETGSWHPKFALVRFLTPQGKAWRLWLGSRNLTVASNLDFGLTLDGLEDAKVGVEIEGIASILARVAEKAGLPKAMANKLLSACGKVRWVVPKGLSVLDLQLLPASRPGLALPRFTGADEVIVVSPFLDGGFVSNAARWGKGLGIPRYLVSTEAELRKLAHQQGMPLAAFKGNLLILESPAREDTDPELIVEDDATSSDDMAPDEELVVRGLHAKLFAVRHKSTWQLWVGSANATTRAWGGANHELVALLEGDKAIGAGLHALLGTCRTVSLASLQDAPPAEQDEAERDIERARKQISAAFESHLARDGDDFRLVGDAAFPPIPEHVRVEVALMTGPLIEWPVHSLSIALGKFDLADQTGLVQWRLSIGKIECRWLQALEVRPPLAVERDHAAIAARMTPSQFVAWIRSLLSGEPEGTGGMGSWKSQGTPLPPAPLVRITLEEVLGSRARRGSRVAELDARIGAYLHYVMQRHSGQPEVLAQLQEFSNLWQQVRTELLR